MNKVYKYINKLVSDDHLIKKDGRFVLKSNQCKYTYMIDQILGEDAIWEKDIKKHFNTFSINVWNIWIYGFLQIFNNAIEHSSGRKITVVINENRVFTSMYISDDGIGIFNNIKNKFNLIEEKDALLELAKGKRTTDKTRHSGQGIFFSSKIFDAFTINSNGIKFIANSENGCEQISARHKFSTLVYMRLANNSDKLIKDIFDKFSTEIPGDFDKTIVPIHLANKNDLISRSQARRILSGLELFKEVLLDFEYVVNIGQAFADEIFRVFKNLHPDISISVQNANPEIQNMINRAVNTKI